MSATGSCMYCSQLLKDRTNDFHRNCKDFFYRKAFAALGKSRPGEYLELNVKRVNHLEKVKLCRECYRVLLPREIEEAIEFIRSTKAKQANGYCKNCAQVKLNEEASLNSKEEWRQETETRRMRHG